MAQPSNREQLLEGAVECLRTKGYARTTARDIAAASGANLASIGYHFGSKDGLLTEAVIRSGWDWTARLTDAAGAPEGAAPLEQMGAAWIEMLGAFEELRPVLVGFVEAAAQAAWSEDVRVPLAEHYAEVRAKVADAVRASLGEDSAASPEIVASFLIAVCDGFMLQWLLDPGTTPTGEELLGSLGAALNQALDAG